MFSFFVGGSLPLRGFFCNRAVRSAQCDCKNTPRPSRAGTPRNAPSFLRMMTASRTSLRFLPTTRTPIRRASESMRRFFAANVSHFRYRCCAKNKPQIMAVALAMFGDMRDGVKPHGSVYPQFKPSYNDKTKSAFFIGIICFLNVGLNLAIYIAISN